MKLTLILENIRSGGNVGSILRTSDGLAVSEVLLAGYTPRPPHREILKTSLGAEAAVRWRHVGEDVGSAIAALRQSGTAVYALEQTADAVPLEAFARSAPDELALVLGNEVRGVTPNTLAACEGAVEILQAGIKQSLNVSVAAGIAAWRLAGGRGA